MTKSRAKPNKLFHSKLDEVTMALVRNAWPNWIQRTSVEQGEPQQMSMDLLQDFVQHLKSRSSKFRGVNLYELKSSQPGTGQLYDYMRKRVGKHDQQRSVTPAKLKTAPTKAKTPEIATPQKKIAKDNQITDEPPVRVGAQPIPGHHEERNVKYYKYKHSSASNTVSENMDHYSYNQDSAVQGETGNSAHHTIKQLFASVIDANAHVPISQVLFKWTQPGDVTVNIQAAKPPTDAGAN